jgi:hypothetical protein
VNRAERASANTCATREHGNRAATENRHATASVALGIGIESRYQRPQLGRDYLAAPPIGDAGDIVPLTVRAQPIGHLEQGRFAFEAHDAVELRQQLDRELVAEAREMATHREMARDPVVTEVADQCAEPIDIELKDQGKADQDRIQRLRCGQDLLAFLLEIKNLDAIALAPQRGREITETQIRLLLEAD